MGKIMKEGKQYGVGGTQKADEITYGSGTVADALNNLNGMLGIQNRGIVSDLNDIQSGTGTIAFTKFTRATSNIPYSGAGVCFTILNTDSDNYGRQIVIGNTGIYSRAYNSGSWQTWQKVDMTNV